MTEANSPGLRISLLFNKLLCLGNVDIFLQDSQEEKDDTEVSAASCPGHHMPAVIPRVLFSILHGRNCDSCLFKAELPLT